MGHLEIISKIKREALSGEHYFQSILEEAYGAQLLSESELEKIQFDCLTLLAKKTHAFNGGESSSIPAEKAQGILASILFTMGVSLKVYSNPDDAVSALQSMGAEAICAEGRKRIDRLVEQAKAYHKALVRHLLQIKNAFYSATVVEGISGFFKLYDASFSAQEIHITADYPVYNKAPRLLGIEFIIQYLKQLSCENLFCTHFAQEDIHHLLCGYDEQYENLLLNIYEPVLAAALGCILAGAPANSLEITPQMQSFLQQYFAGKKRSEIVKALDAPLATIAKSLSFSDSLLNYVQQSLPQLAATIENAAQTGRLARVFIATAYPQDNPRLTISYGKKMDDELYREVLERFMSSASMPDKISIIKNHIHSLADMEDLLLDAMPSAEEITIILKSLSPAEIVALMKKYGPAYEMSFAELRDCEKTLCDGLYGFVASLPSEQQALLERAVKAPWVQDDLG